jgi:hypothetical protein
MQVTISTKDEGEYATFTFKSDGNGYGEWLDSDGDMLGTEYNRALSELARCVAYDVYASDKTRADATQALNLSV